MINSVTLVGRITKDIDLKSTSGGKSYARLTLAVTRNVKTKSGEYETDYIECLAWSRTAEYLQKYASKGEMVAILGRIETSSYENKKGDKVYSTYVVVEDVTLTTKPKSKEGFVTHEVTKADLDISSDALPFY